MTAEYRVMMVSGGVTMAFPVELLSVKKQDGEHGERSVFPTGKGVRNGEQAMANRNQK
jgi:hypothetical protein